MAEEPVIVNYFKRIFSNPEGSLMGKIEDADVNIKGELCPRKGKKDQLFLYGRLEDGRLRDLKFMCALCDPHMFVAADILCRLAPGKNREEVEALDLVSYEGLLDGSSSDGFEHFKRARELLVLGMLEAEAG
jgi:NifU-like protein involved in Fe-S cluster formation